MHCIISSNMMDRAIVPKITFLWLNGWGVQMDRPEKFTLSEQFTIPSELASQLGVGARDMRLDSGAPGFEPNKQTGACMHLVRYRWSFSSALWQDSTIWNCINCYLMEEKDRKFMCFSFIWLLNVNLRIQSVYEIAILLVANHEVDYLIGINISHMIFSSIDFV